MTRSDITTDWKAMAEMVTPDPRPYISPRERGEALAAWADAVEAERTELALLISLETGKPIKDALEIDLRGVVRAIRWYAQLADKLHGDHPDVGRNDVALVSRVPVGVVGILLPWNFPLSPVGYDIAPALLLGNSVVVKPSGGLLVSGAKTAGNASAKAR